MVNKILIKVFLMHDKLNKLLLYLELFKFSILHPKNGIQILQTALQMYGNSKYNIDDYNIKPLETTQAINFLFPDFHFSDNKSDEKLSYLQNHLNSFFKKLEHENYPSKKKPYPIDYSLENFSNIFLYMLCKIIKPDVVVETGVAYGTSSSYILQALCENNRGKLYSIDSVFRPWESKSMIGSAIPYDDLRSRWQLILGPTSNTLNKLLNTLGKVDIFFHDSLHTFKNMMFEFETAWPFIKKDGYLISDDILNNSAFHKFSISNNTQPIIVAHKFSNTTIGVLRKSSN